MSTTNSYPSERFRPLLKAIHNLLRYLPIRSEMDSIRVMAGEPSREVVVVYLASGLTLTTLTRSLIEWHRTLDTSAIAAERSAGGATLRMGLIGRANDINIEVWGEVPYDLRCTGLLIDPERRTFLSLDELAYWMINDWMHGHDNTSNTCGSQGDEDTDEDDDWDEDDESTDEGDGVETR